ncbi:metallophosphoesterase [Myxococcus sp. CA051A]|uniref:metallophosphoesterase family protein n=1 Tax=Myxococcus sp. CA051A TaxID=2741739 RepID=UPI00157B3D7F|nr:MULTISPECIES: metallophosphoesterase [unclassified Myxococcus]NTX37757.1 metallophosphoesterase [Myxococcus sp. CA033]NTX61187.1 metallophosphoesterase [Myxococcus sp. CA051A]
MRILTLDEVPCYSLPYQAAAPRGGCETVLFPLLRGTVDALPDEVAALLVLSDLQGVAPHALQDGAVALLGEVLADELAILGELGTLPQPGTVGVVLAGDLYSEANANVRGASGDVRAVWQAFAEHFRWVVGVAGNHDTFGGAREQVRFQQRPGIHLLDGEVVDLEGLRVGGVGGIIGNPDKAGRRGETDFLRQLDATLRETPDVLVLHQGPDVEGTRLRGSPVIRESVQRRANLLVVCGHAHWETPLATLPGGTQVLNVDSRAVLLERAKPSA